MNNKILIITVFISNIAFGAILSLPTTLKTINTKNTSKISNKAVKQLSSRGLEQDIAQKKVKTSLANNEEINEIMAQNILKSIQSLKERDIISYISKASLLGHKVDLSSYETIIALVQTTNLNLEKKILSKIEKVSVTNEKLKQIKALS
ncbi:hypothetical protein [Sulfurimonas sp.]